MIERWRLSLVLALPLALFVAGSAACSAGHPDATDGTSETFSTDGRCDVDGETRACHVETGRSNGILNCFSGVSVCNGGRWGACGGSGTLSSYELQHFTSRAGAAERAGSLLPASVIATEPSTDAGGCASNACNPYCVGVDVNADSLVPDGGFTQFTILGTVKAPDQFPGGITGPKNAMSTFASSNAPAYAQCTQGHPPADGKICSSDYCCAAYPVGPAAYTCQPWVTVGGTNPIADAKCVKATGVDFQLGLACNDANAQVHVPVCNRGTADAKSGKVMIAEYPGNPKYAGDLSGPPGGYCNNPGDPSAYCLLDVGKRNIPAGKCLDVNLSAGTVAGSAAGITCPSSSFSSGNRTMAVNPLAPPLAGASAFSPSYATVPEADYCNNYSFHPTTAQGGTCSAYGEQPPPPQALSFRYTASCTPGFRASWNQLAYSTAVPAESQIQFHVSTAQSTDGGVGAFTTPVLAANIKSTSSPDPAVCPMSGSTTGACPKDLGALLGTPAKYDDVLEVKVTEIAVSALPIVYSWQVTFNCVPYE